MKFQILKPDSIIRIRIIWNVVIRKDTYWIDKDILKAPAESKGFFFYDNYHVSLSLSRSTMLVRVRPRQARYGSSTEAARKTGSRIRYGSAVKR